MDEISLIVVTFNSGAVLARALETVPKGVEIIIVDNNSGDDSVLIAQQFVNCTVIQNSCNVGFGTACNQAVKIASGELLFFVNPDIVLPSTALAGLLNAARIYPEAAAIGPTLLPMAYAYEQNNGQMSDEAFASDIDLNAISSPSTLSGAALLCRRSAFDRVGGFDERFFLYFEDTDLCIRLKRDCGSLILMHDIFAFHTPGKSSRLTRSEVFTKYRHYGLSRSIFSEKHGGEFKPLAIMARQFIGGIGSFCKLDSDRAFRKFGRFFGYAEGWIRNRLRT